MVEIFHTDEFEAWYLELEEVFYKAVDAHIAALEQAGVALGHPYSSELLGSRYALRELRIKSSGHALRIAYAFDPLRDAVLILGGDKTGDPRFYESFIPRAEKI